MRNIDQVRQAHIDGLVQGWGISSKLAMDILRPSTKTTKSYAVMFVI